MSHPANEQLIESRRDNLSECCNAPMIGDIQCEACGSNGIVNHDVCTRCQGSDESAGGTANMVDGKLGLCAVCADDMGVR